MGARGKKRKRADGSTATGQGPNTSARPDAYTDRPIAEVSGEAIREIMPFMISGGDLSDVESERDLSSFQSALVDVSTRHAVDDDDLDYRASRLGWLIESKRPDLMEQLTDGTLLFDPRLLDFIARFNTKNPSVLVEWVNKEFPPP